MPGRRKKGAGRKEALLQALLCSGHASGRILSRIGSTTAYCGKQSLYRFLTPSTHSDPDSRDGSSTSATGQPRTCGLDSKLISAAQALVIRRQRQGVHWFGPGERVGSGPDEAPATAKRSSEEGSIGLDNDRAGMPAPHTDGACSRAQPCGRGGEALLVGAAQRASITRKSEIIDRFGPGNRV
jgi:hypothetical protein